jgi:hypothetical protein
MSEEENNETTETEVAEAETPSAVEVQPPAEEPMDEKTEINKLLDEGYSVKQIIELGFKRRTAYYYAKKRTKPENEQTSGNETTPAASNGRFKHDLIKLLGYSENLSAIRLSYFKYSQSIVLLFFHFWYATPLLVSATLVFYTGTMSMSINMLSVILIVRLHLQTPASQRTA